MVQARYGKKEVQERAKIKNISLIAKGVINCENCLKRYLGSYKICPYCAEINWLKFEREHRFRNYKEGREEDEWLINLK